MNAPATLLEQHPGACYNARQSVPRPPGQHRLPNEPVYLPRGTGSVSYTHLDVYKRQGPAFSFSQHCPSFVAPPDKLDQRDNHKQQLAYRYDCLCVHERSFRMLPRTMTEHRPRFYHGQRRGTRGGAGIGGMMRRNLRNEPGNWSLEFARRFCFFAQRRSSCCKRDLPAPFRRAPAASGAVAQAASLATEADAQHPVSRAICLLYTSRCV